VLLQQLTEWSASALPYIATCRRHVLSPVRVRLDDLERRSPRLDVHENHGTAAWPLDPIDSPGRLDISRDALGVPREVLERDRLLHVVQHMC
jgi:hypothetical protein